MEWKSIQTIDGTSTLPVVKSAADVYKRFDDDDPLFGIGDRFILDGKAYRIDGFVENDTLEIERDYLLTFTDVTGVAASKRVEMVPVYRRDTDVWFDYYEGLIKPNDKFVVDNELYILLECGLTTMVIPYSEVEGGLAAPKAAEAETEEEEQANG